MMLLRKRLPHTAFTTRYLASALIALTLAAANSACSAQDDRDAPTLRTVGHNESDSLRAALRARRDKANDDVDQSRRNAITDAVEIAAPAIVGINVTEVREVRYRDPWSFLEEDPFFRDFQMFVPRGGSRTYRQELHGLGSGFLISSDGYIITNDHVAGGATKIVVTTTDGKEHEARIVGTDHNSDVALLKIEGDNFPYLEIGNSDDVLVGEWAIAMGNPFGLFDINAKPTVTVGVVSNTNVDLRPSEERVYVGMIQTDAAISSGNSGGPLLNALGEVIGMNTVIYSTSQSYQGAGSIGIGFSVPINRVMEIVDELKKNGRIDRNFWTGMAIRPVDANVARYFGLGSTEGAVIVEIAPRSPADAAGLLIGDVIVRIGERTIRNDEDAILVINDARAGDKLDIDVVRNGKTENVSMTLTRRQ